MKKLLFALVCLAGAMSAQAWPGCHPPPPPHWHHHGGGWGRGGSNFWPGFAGALTGTIIGNAISQPRQTVVVQQPVVTTPVVTQPVVVQQPVVVTQPVAVRPAYTSETVIGSPVAKAWVEGRYVDQIQANGTTVRVWQPGHYEYR